MSFSGSSMGNGAGCPTRRALGRDLPHVEGERHEVLGGQCRVVRQSLDATRLRRAGAVEPSLARDHHTLGEVAEHGVGRAAERAPRARSARALPLLPDDLATEEHAEAVLEDRDHVGRQRAIRLAAEVRDVDRDAAAGLELACALGEHLGEHLEVLEVRAGHALALELLLVVLAREVRRRRDDERDRPSSSSSIDRASPHTNGSAISFGGGTSSSVESSGGWKRS